METDGRVWKECIKRCFLRKKPCGIYQEVLRCLCSWRYKQAFTKWVTGKRTSKLFICLPKPLLLKFCIVSWQRNEKIFGSSVFFCSSSWCCGYAESSCLSWVELLTSSSYKCLATGLNPVYAAGKWSWKLWTTRISGWRSWDSLSDGPSPVLGLACCPSELSAWASAEIHVIPQHMSTQVLCSASVMDPLGFVLQRCLWTGSNPVLERVLSTLNEK